MNAETFTAAIVIYNPSQAVINNAFKLFDSIKKSLGIVQTVVVDNSPATNMEKFIGKVDKYLWNARYNIYWAGGINKAVEYATGSIFIHFLPTRGIERNPEWVKKLIAPLSDVKVGMAGPKVHCYYDRVTNNLTGLERDPLKQYLINQAVFAARTDTLRKHPWTGDFPHAYSDTKHCIDLIRAGYTLVNVPEVSSMATGLPSNPHTMFEAGPHI